MFLKRDAAPAQEMQGERCGQEAAFRYQRSCADIRQSFPSAGVDSIPQTGYFHRNSFRPGLAPLGMAVELVVEEITFVIVLKNHILPQLPIAFVFLRVLDCHRARIPLAVIELLVHGAAN